MQLQMPPGEVTLLGLCPSREGKWRLVVSKGEVTDKPAIPLGAPNYFVKLNRPIHEWLEDFGATEAAHHLSMAYGDWTKHLETIAKLFKVEYRYV